MQATKSKSHSIQTRLAVIVFLSLSCISAAGLTALMYQDVESMKSDLVKEAQAYGSLISEEAIELVSIGSIETAAELSRKLRQLELVEAIIITDSDNMPLFGFEHDDDVENRIELGVTDTQGYRDGSLFVRYRLETAGLFYGDILFQMSTKSIEASFSSYRQQLLIIALGVLFTSLLLVYLLRRMLTGPVLRLARIFGKLGQQQNCSLHLPVDRDDEIGALFDGFNKMQDAIQIASRRRIEMQDALDQHAIVAITNIDGDITYVNDKFIEISGYSREELIGKNHRILNSGTHDLEFFREMYRIISKGEVWQGDICNMKKDGSLYWVATTVVPLLNSMGRPHRYIAMRTDITLTKSIEQELIASEGLYRNLIETSSAVAWEVDVDTLRFTYVGPQIEQISGYPPASWTNFEFWAGSIHPDDRESSVAYCQQETAEGNNHSFEYRMIKQDGSIVWIRDVVSVIQEEGKVSVLRGYFFDITEQKRSEEALRRAQKMDAVDQLTGGIAHDFNNILGIIQGNVNMLQTQDDDFSDKARKRISTINKSAQRAIDLTRQLLSFSTRQVSSRDVTDINFQLNEIGSLVDHSVTPQISVKYYLQEDLWKTEIDAGEFSDAVVNLVINARDAMPSGGNITIITENATIKNSFSPDLPAGDYVVMVINDTGEGMSDEVVERVFEPFYTTKPQGKGTGLGLAMVFGFVTRSGGVIHLNSEQGVGTTFRVYLPRAKAAARNNSDTSIEISKLSGGNETILAVDDEVSLLELVVDSLQPLGYKVLTANDPRQALDIIKGSEQIDLLLTDIVMPGGMNGIELAEIVNQQYPEICVLLSSGYTEMAVVNNIQERLGTELLVKPYDMRQLLESVKVALRNHNKNADVA